MKKRILSGMRPTGKLHIGHLLGALQNWVELQEKYDCFFMAADWHALMSEYEDPRSISENILDNVIDWLSCGINPEKSTIFIQSHIPAHLELYMVFSLITPLGLLERCPTYKEQLRQVHNRDLNTYGFLGYPVLQAADILLYKASCVPVGDDQLPHLELTREIARKFNSLYKHGVFPEPEAILTQVPRFLGLDGRKMSKSYDNFIALSETKDSVRKKIGGMFTDPSRIRISDPGHPDGCNVHNYYAVFFPQKERELTELCRQAKIGCTACKKELAEAIINFLEPIQEERLRLLDDKKAVIKILKEGQEKAVVIASKTMSEVRNILGL
ncbi:MAG: tryptophan--tRNA ligase [Candidatus Omnitrophota bacterium]